MAEIKIKGMEMKLKGPHKFGDKRAGHHKGIICPIFMLLTIIIHILLAMWVYQDIRKRNRGSGIWIAIALLAGLLGAGVYAVVRIGDKDQNS